MSKNNTMNYGLINPASSPKEFRRAGKRLLDWLSAKGMPSGHPGALDALCSAFGVEGWNTMSALLKQLEDGKVTSMRPVEFTSPIEFTYDRDDDQTHLLPSADSHSTWNGSVRSALMRKPSIIFLDEFWTVLPDRCGMMEILATLGYGKQMMQDNAGDTAAAITGEGMVVLKVLDMVEHCYTYEDGQVVALSVRAVLRDGGAITLDCHGVDSFSTSFVNEAFIDLLDEFSMEVLRARLKVTNNMPFNNNLVKMRFTQAGLVVQ